MNNSFSHSFYQSSSSSYHQALKNCFQVNVNSSKLTALISQIIDKLTIHQNKINSFNQKLNLSNDTINQKINKLNMDFTSELQLTQKKISQDIRKQNLLIIQNDKAIQQKDRTSISKFQQYDYKVENLKTKNQILLNQINKLNQSIFGTTNSITFQSINNSSQKSENFSYDDTPIIRFGKRISSNATQSKIKPITQIIKDYQKKFIDFQKIIKEQIQSVKKQLKEALQSQDQNSFQDEQKTVIHTKSGKKLKKNQRLMNQFAQKLDSLQFRIKQTNVQGGRSRFNANNKNQRKSKLKRNGTYIRISGYEKANTENDQEVSTQLENKIIKLSDYLKGSIRQLQSQIDLCKNKSIVNDEKIGFVMRKVDKFHLENIDIKNQMKKAEENRTDDRAVQNIKNQFKAFMKQVTSACQTKLQKQQFYRQKTKIHQRYKIIHQNLIQKVDKGQIKKALVFLEQKIKEIIILVAQNKNMDQDGAAKKIQLKCLSCDKDLQKNVKNVYKTGFNVRQSTNDQSSKSLRTATQKIRKRMKAYPNILTQMQSDD